MLLLLKTDTFEENARLKTRMWYLCFPSITLSVLSFASLLPATNTRLFTSHNVPPSLWNFSSPLRDCNQKRQIFSYLLRVQQIVVDVLLSPHEHVLVLVSRGIRKPASCPRRHPEQTVQVWPYPTKSIIPENQKIGFTSAKILTNTVCVFFSLFLCHKPSFKI